MSPWTEERSHWPSLPDAFEFLDNVDPDVADQWALSVSGIAGLIAIVAVLFGCAMGWGVWS